MQNAFSIPLYTRVRVKIYLHLEVIKKKKALINFTRSATPLLLTRRTKACVKASIASHPYKTSHKLSFFPLARICFTNKKPSAIIALVMIGCYFSFFYFFFIPPKRVSSPYTLIAFSHVNELLYFFSVLSRYRR